LRVYDRKGGRANREESSPSRRSMADEGFVLMVRWYEQNFTHDSMFRFPNV